MFTKLAIVATPLLLASSVSATVAKYGKIDIKVDGKIQGCLGPDALWNIDGNCETYRALRQNFGGDDDPNNFIWSLLTPDGHACNAQPKGEFMNCEEAWEGRFVYHHKELANNTALKMANMYAAAMPQPCGVAQLLGGESDEVSEFPITMIWRQVPKPAGKKRAANLEATVTKKPSAGEASTCTSTSTVAATTTNSVPHPYLDPPGTLEIEQGNRRKGCLNSEGMWVIDKTKCAVFQGVAVNHDFKLRTGDNWCFVETLQQPNNTVFKCAPDAEDRAQIWENTDFMLKNPHARDFNLEYWYTDAVPKQNKDEYIFADTAKIDFVSIWYVYVDE